jgi:hypothetical protein
MSGSERAGLPQETHCRLGNPPAGKDMIHIVLAPVSAALGRAGIVSRPSPACEPQFGTRFE